MPFHQDQLPYLLQALTRPTLAGDVVPLPINPGPQAGRPTGAESQSAPSNKNVLFPPFGGSNSIEETMQRLRNSKSGFQPGPRGL